MVSKQNDLFMDMDMDMGTGTGTGTAMEIVTAMAQVITRMTKTMHHFSYESSND